MSHMPASAPAAYPAHKDSTWPPAFLDGLQLADEVPPAGQEPLVCSGMSAANTRNSNLLLSSGSNAWSAAHSQHNGAPPADPCAVAATTGVSCEMLPASHDAFDPLLPEQVDSLLSSSNAPTAPNSACSQLQDVDIACQMEDHITEQAAAVAVSDCSLDSMAWLMGLNTATAPSTTGQMPLSEPLSGYAGPWCPAVPAHLDPTNHFPAATMYSREASQQWQVAPGALQSPTAAAAGASAAAAATPHSPSGFDAATLTSRAKLGATCSTQLRGSSSSNGLSQLRTSSMTFSATNSQVVPGVAGNAAPRGSSPEGASVKPMIASAPSTEARREANKLNQRRQRQRRNEDMELLRSKVSVFVCHSQCGAEHQRRDSC